MTSGSNDIRLTRYKNVEDKYIFFYQRWQELLDYRTLDMHRYKILNSAVACIELFNTINKTLDGFITSRSNVDDLKSEALDIIKSDDILQKYNRPLWICIMQILVTRIEAKSKEPVSDDRDSSFYSCLNRIKYRLIKPIKKLKEEYLNYLLSEIKVDLDNQNLECVNKHILALISQCIMMGWSSSGLFGLLSVFEGTQGYDNKWEIFSREISKALENYCVFLTIHVETRPELSAPTVRDTIENMGVHLNIGSEIIESEDTLKSSIDAEKYYASVNINATDPYTAALNAVNSINRIISIASFYNMINPGAANSSNIIILNNNSKLVEIFPFTNLFKTYEYIDMSNNVFENTRLLFNNLEKKEICNKLTSVFTYTDLSRTASFQETKYLTLWIALESVMRTGQYSDIISHIKKVLPETLCLRYFYRLVRNFAEDCIRCSIRKVDEINIVMTLPNKKELVHDLISIFRDEHKYEILRNRCGINKLLAFRCNEIRQLLNNKDEIYNKLVQHRQKISWHIQRLYRIRNEISHSAFQDNYSLVIYIEHLYTYLAQLIAEVVFYAEQKDMYTIEEIYASLVDNYDTYIQLLKENAFELNNILPNGIIDIL